MGDKVFRDPLYNYISIDRKRDGWLLELLDCPEVQRLRRIHQLGVSNFTFSGADHNRLAHSMGVVHLMQRVLAHLGAADPTVDGGAAHDALLAAALVHDVGHGPFSHLFEPVLGINHEKWSIEVVLRDTEVNRVLKARNKFLPQHVADLIDEKNHDHPSWQKSLLSSQLDVDRLDYLRRDSLFSGAGYGHFDWHRLLTTVEFYGEEMDLVWPEKAALAIEEYIFARFYMYQNVYHHKTTRGFEQLLQAMWKRAAVLRQRGDSVNPVPVLEAFWNAKSVDPTHKDALGVKQYLDIEEFTVLSQIQAWRTHSDPSLADLARRFLVRDGFAMIHPPAAENPLQPEDDKRWHEALVETVKQCGFAEPEMYCLIDNLDGKYRRPYKPEKDADQQTAGTAIRVCVGDQSEPVEISEFLPRLAAVTKAPPAKRLYYVPKEARAAAQKLREQWVKAGS